MAMKVLQPEIMIKYESRFVKLEQNNKDTAVENAELKARVAKLEQKQSQTDDDAKRINQSLVNTISIKIENSNDTLASNISDNSDIAPERIENSSDITSDDTYQKKNKISQSYKKKETNNIVGNIFDFTTTSISDKNHVTKISVMGKAPPVTENLNKKNPIIMLSNPNTELSNDRDEFIDNSSDVLTEAEICEEIKTLPETEVSITTTSSISSSQISNLEDIVNENSEFLEIVNIFDSFSDSNSNGSKDKEDEFLGEEDKSLQESK
ncbi:30944_t:CDS:2, partial [Gigaspora margarita]